MPQPAEGMHLQKLVAVVPIHQSGLREMGSGLTPDHSHSCPADVLVAGWERGKPAAFDNTVTSPLCPAVLGEASRVAGAAALAAETCKHMANDKKCQELGWACVPIAMETYGNWSQEAKDTFSRLASCLATGSSQPKSKVISDLYGRLNLTLMRAIARAILSRAFRPIRTVYLSRVICLGFCNVVGL